MNKKPTTIDDLAIMVQKGFDQVDERFAKVDQQFVEFRSEVDQRFTQVDQELRTIRKQLEGVVYRPEFEALQDQVRDMQRVLGRLKKAA